MAVGAVGERVRRAVPARAADTRPGPLERGPARWLAALRTRMRARPAAASALVLGLTVLAYAVLVWERRWISDDGLIFLRTVRQILDGNGPVFNAGERVEANTSTVWTLILLGLALLPVRLELASVATNLVLAVGALALALDAARRFHARGRVVVPAGALVLLAVPPFWDFGTSGLENALSWTWLALTWWLLVRRWQRPGSTAAAVPAAGRRWAWPVALVIGLGPLVRPDLAVFSVAAGAALAVLQAPRTGRDWARLVGIGAVAVAVPAGYEVFRAGYYGLLVPATALAKEASTARWGRGMTYLGDTVRPYWLWVPALALVVAVGILVRPRLQRWRRPDGAPPPDEAPTPDEGTAAIRRARAWRRAGTAAVGLAPVLGGAAMVAYVVRVGGDFMHARMLLPAVFCLLLPVMALPVRRAVALPLAVLLGWSLVAGMHLRPSYQGIGTYGIADERDFYVDLLGTSHPLTADDYRMHPYALGGVEQIEAAHRPVLAVEARGRGPAGPEWETIPLAPGHPSGMVWLNLGVAGVLAPLDVRVTDTVGLAEPVAAHTMIIPNGRVGHDKNLPVAWTLAEGGGVAPDERAVYPEDVTAASRALQCPSLRELDASVHAPMTPARFWANLVGAPARTALRIPRDPVLAEVTCR